VICSMCKKKITRIAMARTKIVCQKCYRRLVIDNKKRHDAFEDIPVSFKISDSTLKQENNEKIRKENFLKLYNLRYSD